MNLGKISYFSSEYYNSAVRNKQRRSIKKLIRKYIKFKISNLKVSEFAAKNRIIESGPRQGLYDPYYTPYNVEPMDELSINSTTQRVIYCKSAQVGATTASENVICFYIGEHPTDQMYISGNDKLLQNWSENKLDPAIKAFGLEKYIKSNIEKKHKKTGDRTFKKDYHGCSLILTTARSASGLRSTDRQVLVRDEIDSAPKLLATGEGTWLGVSFARTNSWGPRRKVFDFSTPTSEDGAIWTEYLKGDCRRFNVACPDCGGYQVLEFGDEETEYGLKGEIENEKVKDAYYVCEHCGFEIRDKHKSEILRSGYWKPTKESELLFTKSYHISSLYSPPGMISFIELFEKWHIAKRDREELKSFTNLYMGLPYEDDVDQPNIDDIAKNIDNYEQFTVPDNVLFLTLGADIQEGSKVDKNNPPRIELEITGHGRGYRTWNIGYKVFHGKTSVPHMGAWKKFEDWIKETGLTFNRDDGIKVQVSFGLIDSGDGVYTDLVYKFCRKYKILFPSKGTRMLKPRPGEIEKSDVRTSGEKIRYRPTRITDDDILYTLSTVLYKDILYTNIQIPREDSHIQKPGFCFFPKGTKKEYFRQLTSEKRKKDDNGVVYYQENRTIRNEPCDCRVMNLAAHDIWLDIQIKKQKDFYKKRGWTKEKIDKINSATILGILDERFRKATSKLAS